MLNNIALFFFFCTMGPAWAQLGPRAQDTWSGTCFGPKVGPAWAQDSWSSTFFGPKLGPRLGLTRARLEKRKTNKVFFY